MTLAAPCMEQRQDVQWPRQLESAVGQGLCCNLHSRLNTELGSFPWGWGGFSLGTSTGNSGKGKQQIALSEGLQGGDGDGQFPAKM